MPSMFKTMAKSLIREVGQKDLKPVSSLSNSSRFRPFCLLKKKYNKHKFWSKKFICTEFSLMDILEPNFPVPEVNQERHFYFWNKVNRKLEGAMAMNSKIDIELSAGAEKCHGSSLEMQILTVSYQTWRSLQMERKLVEPEPSFIGELRRQGEDLYVVTEAMELLNFPVLENNLSLEGAGNISFSEMLKFQGKGKGHRGKQKLVTVPPQSVLAFRAVKLSISENNWGILYFLDKKQKTFQDRKDSENEYRSGMREELHVQTGQDKDNQQEPGIARL